MGQSRNGEVRAEHHSNGDAAAIRHQMEQTRAEMSSTVNAIEERMSPAHLKEQVTSVKDHVLGEIKDAKLHVLEEFKEAKDKVTAEVKHDIDEVRDKVRGEIQDARFAVREATVGRVEHMIERAGDQARDTGASIMETVRANPIPIAMIGIGLAWLFVGRTSQSMSSTGQPGLMRRTLDKGKARASELVDTAQWKVEGVGQSASDMAHRAQDKVSSLAHDAQDKVSSLAHDAKDQVTSLAHDAKDQVVHYKDVGRNGIVRAEHRVESIVTDNPLATGAVLFAIGAAAGLALPHSEKEDRLMGEMKQKLVEKFEGVARDALGDMEEKARSAMHPPAPSKEPSAFDTPKF